MSREELYKKSYFNRIGELSDLVPEVFEAFMNFDRLALAEGKLTKKLKELIAIAVAHTTGCPYCIELHVKQGKSKDVSKEEMSEAIMVATALKAGSALAHGVNALNAYDQNEEEELYRASYFNRLKEFSKLKFYDIVYEITYCVSYGACENKLKRETSESLVLSRNCKSEFVIFNHCLLMGRITRTLMMSQETCRKLVHANTYVEIGGDFVRK